MVRYGNIEAFNRMPLRICNRLILKCFEEDNKRIHWEMWLARYPTMTKEDFIPFEKFYNTPIQRKEIKKAKGKTMAEMMELQETVIGKIKNKQCKEVKM